MSIITIYVLKCNICLSPRLFNVVGARCGVCIIEYHRIAIQGKAIEEKALAGVGIQIKVWQSSLQAIL